MVTGTATAVAVMLAAALLAWPRGRILPEFGAGSLAPARWRTPVARRRRGAASRGGRFVRRTSARGVSAAGLALAAAALSTAFGGPVALAVSIAAAVAVHLGRRARATATARRDLVDLATALRSIGRELDAGATPGQAAARVSADATGALRATLAPLVEPVPAGGTSGVGAPGSASGVAARSGADRLGDSRGARTKGIAARRTAPRGMGRAQQAAAPTAPARRLWGAWDLAAERGVPLTAVIGALAADLDDRIDVARLRAGHVAGPAVSGYVLSALPIAGIALGAGMGSDPLAVLTGGGAGGVLLVVGVALVAVGLLWTGRIVRGGADD